MHGKREWGEEGSSGAGFGGTLCWNPGPSQLPISLAHDTNARQKKNSSRSTQE